MLGLAIWIGRGPLVVLLAAGLAPDLRGLAGQSLGWSALALPAALLAALWATRLQHERDFVGMYGANLVVNGVLVIALLFIAVNDPSTKGLIHLGGYFLLAMGLRLGWLVWGPRGPPGGEIDAAAAARLRWADVAAGLAVLAAARPAGARGSGHRTRRNRARDSERGPWHAKTGLAPGG